MGNADPERLQARRRKLGPTMLASLLLGAAALQTNCAQTYPCEADPAHHPCPPRLQRE